MDRTQFTFYESFYKALARIRRGSDRARAYDAIVRFALYGEEPDLEALSPDAAIALEVIRPNLAAGRRKARAGKKGGESRKQSGSKAAANGKQTESKPEAKGKQEQERGQEEERGQMSSSLPLTGGERRGEALAEALRKLRGCSC